MTNEVTTEASPEQTVYANLLEKGMLLGLGVMFLTFILYAAGLIAPAVPMERLPEFWAMNVTDYLNAIEAEYLHLGHTATGWTWISLLSYGDFMNFSGIAILSIITIICYARIVPILWKNNDKIYAYIAIAEVIVLTAAASGYLGSGGH